MLRDTRTVKDAVYLIDDYGFGSKFRNGAASGWDMDARGRCEPEKEIRGNLLCTNGEGKYDVYAKRELVPVREGKAGFANMFTLHYGEGFYIRFYDASEDERKISFEIAAKDGYITANGIKTEFAAESKTYFFSVDFDFDKKTALFYINNKKAGTYNLMSDSLSRLVYGAKADTKTCAAPVFTRLWINYLLVDKCYCYCEEPLYDKWNFEGKDGTSAALVANAEGHSYAVISENGNFAKVSRAFERTSGKVEFEIKYATEKAGASVRVSLLDGDKEALTVTDNGEGVFHNGVLLRKHHVNVWQTLRMIADSESGRADIYLNGKKCGEVQLNDGASAFDGISLSAEGKEYIKLKFLDAVVFKVNPEPADYVPAPVKRVKKDYSVGINVCSLWRSGSHTGWDTITPYKENKTFLGWYDEGLAEVSDWEIKWMYENGIDAEFYCWYNHRPNAPIPGTGLSDAIHNGHFKAKYGDYMKFAIIWEVANGAATCEEGFRNHLVPYWMDYFFSDHRYFTVDNKVVVSVFGYQNLIRDFGSPEGVAKQFDYVREQAKTLGYDGAVFIACGAPSEMVKKCGFDGVHAYSWAMGGYSVEFSKNRIKDQLENRHVHVVPTVSSGFNGIAWDYERTGQMTPSDMGEMFKWIKDDVLEQNTDGENWHKNFVMLSTWNEYGEGTYMCPSGLNGFGYIEEIGKAFTEKSDSFKNVKPDENQLKRLGYMYPPYRSILRCTEWEKKEYPAKHLSYVDFDLDAWETENNLELKLENGVLYGKANEYDPKILMNTDIDADIVKNIRIRMKGGLIGDEVIIYYKTENDSEWSESRSARAYFDSHDMKTYDIYVGASKQWKGKITGIRLDPTSLAGSFEMESIELLADDSSVQLIIGEKQCRLPYSPKLCGGKYCVPYEHGGDVQIYMNLYHEWYVEEGKLILLYDETELVFEIGKDYAMYGDEKIQLSAPTEMFDGLPLLELDALAKAFGFDVDVDGRVINVKL